MSIHQSRLNASQRELLFCLKHKSADSFSILYDKYSGALFGFILKMIANKPVAEELLQDVFMKAWRNADEYDPYKGALYTWMASIARNTCIDYLRSKQYKQSAITTFNPPDEEEIFVSGHTVFNNAENKEIISMIEVLELKYRQVIELVYYKGYSQQQVADGLNLPLGTVKTRSRHALNQLRNMIQGKAMLN